jgi:hypothetical protein
MYSSNPKRVLKAKMKQTLRTLRTASSPKRVLKAKMKQTRRTLRTVKIK